MEKHRFEALDGLRGVAALAVLIFHVDATTTPWIMPHAYLAVDFFFILSGFVIASAYGERLKADMNVSSFMIRRIIRLYPLIAISAIFGFLGFLHLYNFSRLLVLLITGVLLIPTPFGAASEGMPTIPINGVSWSLTCELIANLVYALVARHLSLLRLTAIILLTATFLVIAGFHFGSLDCGGLWSTKWGGLARVGFSFFAGIALFELSAAGYFVNMKLPLWSLIAVLLVVFDIPKNIHGLAVYDLAAVMVLFPVIIVCGANVAAKRWSRICQISGALSYPIYILQSGIMVHMRGLPGHLHLYGAAAIPVILGSIALFGLFSWVILKIYDEPVRAWLTRHLIKRTRLVTVQIR